MNFESKKPEYELPKILPTDYKSQENTLNNFMIGAAKDQGIPVSEDRKPARRPAPETRQKGDAEINPELKGITFNFYHSMKDGYAVEPTTNEDFDELSAQDKDKILSVAQKLNNHIFTDFTQAKRWLVEAAPIALENYEIHLRNSKKR